MRRFDVFNGDADGICALRQVRLAQPAEATPITGLKRDIALLSRVQAGEGDEVTVLDISLERNREALERLLAAGARVRWFDHHRAGAIPPHAALEAVIDESADVCTSILVDRHLGGRFRAWAVAGAFGDALDEAAASLARAAGLAPEATQALCELGRNLNYGACGETQADVLLPAEETWRRAAAHFDPLALAAEPFNDQLGRARRADLALAREFAPRLDATGAWAVALPDAAWSRRVLSAFANERAGADPRRAQAVLVPDALGGFAVSVRVPREASPDAGRFCSRYATGGGRARAAGIGHLPAGEVARFLEELAAAWPAPAAPA